MNINVNHPTYQQALADTIDRLGVVKAQAAELAREEKALKAIIADHGPGAYEGTLYRATVSDFEQERLDMEAVRAKLTPQFIRSHTIVTEVTMVRVTSRNGIKIA